MNADGTKRVQLTTDRADDRMPLRDAGRALRRVHVRTRRRARPLAHDASRRRSDPAWHRRAQHSPWTPFLSRDGRWVTYTNLQRASLKIPVEGGAATPVFDTPEGQPLPSFRSSITIRRLSPDGRLVMGHYRDEGSGERICDHAGEQPRAGHAIPEYVRQLAVGADGRSMVYIDNRRQMGNL